MKKKSTSSRPRVNRFYIRDDETGELWMLKPQSS